MKIILTLMKSKVKGTYLLVPKEVAETESVPKQVQSLFSKFQDIMLKEFPNKLPPIRNIQHQIDLFPRFNLPNLHVTQIKRELLMIYSYKSTALRAIFKRKRKLKFWYFRVSRKVDAKCYTFILQDQLLLH